MLTERNVSVIAQLGRVACYHGGTHKVGGCGMPGLHLYKNRATEVSGRILSGKSGVGQARLDARQDVEE